MDQRLRQVLDEILDTLTERERQILEERFGPGGKHTRTLEEVARNFQTTRDQIRRIEAKTLRKFRHPKRVRKLEEFIRLPGQGEPPALPAGSAGQPAGAHQAQPRGTLSPESS